MRSPWTVTCQICGVTVEKTYKKTYNKKNERYCSLKCAGVGSWEGRRKNPVDRFLSKVDKTPGHGPNGDCWIYTGGRANTGYGMIWMGNRNVGAHVFAYELANGAIAKTDNHYDTVVMHSCDFRPCCNPSHLRLGTQGENIKDMHEKKRHGKKKKPVVTEDFIRKVAQSDPSLSNRKLAKILGVSYGSVRNARLLIPADPRI